MPATSWRCGECGALLPEGEDVEPHFLNHPIPSAAVPASGCAHAPLIVDVARSRIYLWTTAEEPGGGGLETHPGWSPGGAPPVIREIVERENGSDLSTPGWYYPHTPSSARALDRAYHDHLRAQAAAPTPRLPRTVDTRPSRPVRLDVDARSLRGRARAIAVAEMAAGLLMVVLGANVTLVCTGYSPFDGCNERAYGLPGFAAVLIGILVGLWGLGSLLVLPGGEPSATPSDRYPSGPRPDPAVEAGVERAASILWGAILMAILVAMEAFPVYNLVLLTSAAPRPTFNLGAFLVDMALFGIADLIVVFFAVTYASNR